jgi:hypothetical protein
MGFRFATLPCCGCRVAPLQVFSSALILLLTGLMLGHARLLHQNPSAMRGDSALLLSSGWNHGAFHRQTMMPPEVFASSPRGRRIFLLSPASASGIRARLILREQSHFELAVRLRGSGVPLGEIFSFISGLYFRGKLAYARAFAEPPGAAPGLLIITASRGLLLPETPLTFDELREMAEVPIHTGNPRYRVPLERDALHLSQHIGTGCEVVLLGSIATPKYVEPLLGIFGDDLMFPAEFVGRGDMSRGGLMLRAARDGVQFTYTSAAKSLRYGPRPPKLPKLPRVFPRPPDE